MLIHTALLIAGILCLIAAIALVLWPRWVAAVPAFLGLLLMHWSYTIAVPNKTFIFWGIATLITVGLFYLSPKGEPDGHQSSNLYVGLTALAGGLLGILLRHPAYMVLGVILGAAVGPLRRLRLRHPGRGAGYRFRLRFVRRPGRQVVRSHRQCHRRCGAVIRI